MEQDCKQELLFLKKIIETLTASNLVLQARMQQSLVFILEKIMAKRGSLMLINQKTKQFNILASTNPKLINMSVPIDPQSISGYVASSGEAIFLKDISRSKRFKSSARIQNYSSSSLICVPLVGHKKIIGVITASDPLQNKCFTEKDFALFKNYATLVSPLLENVYLLEQLKRRQEKLAQVSRELVLKQKELLMAQQERNELVQMVVHDFKSPLSAVISNLDLLKYIGLDQEQTQIVQTALNGAQKLLEMINEFLEVARLDDWQQKSIELKPVDLVPIVQDVIAEVTPLAQEKNLNIIFKQDNSPTVVFGDRQLLYHLLNNLISNGVKYTPEGGQIEIGWEKRQSKRQGDRFKHFLICYVQDTGPGIPDEHKQTIFERFKRLKKHAQIKGTGVGLYICKRIASLLHGKIWVEDVLPQGSKFCFTCYLVEENA